MLAPWAGTLPCTCHTQCHKGPDCASCSVARHTDHICLNMCCCLTSCMCILYCTQSKLHHLHNHFCALLPIAECYAIAETLQYICKYVNASAPNHRDSCQCHLSCLLNPNQDASNMQHYTHLSSRLCNLLVTTLSKITCFTYIYPGYNREDQALQGDVAIVSVK